MAVKSLSMRVRKHYSAFPPRSFLALQLSGLFFFVLLGDLPQELFHKLFRLSGGKAWVRGLLLFDNENLPIEVSCLSITNSNYIHDELQAVNDCFTGCLPDRMRFRTDA